MKKNTFYQALDYLVNIKKLPSAEIEIAHDTTSQKNSYYRIEVSLPIDPQAKIHSSGYTLDHLHISVFEKINRHQKDFGPAHFTAVFHDEDENEYRIHIHLTQKDRLAVIPSFEVKEGDSYHGIPKPAAFNYFVFSILKLAQPTLTNLRGMQEAAISDLKTKYNKKEQQLAALFNALPDNKKEYLDELEKLRELTIKLSKISLNQQWHGISKFLNRLKQVISGEKIAHQSLKEVPKTRKYNKRSARRKGNRPVKQTKSIIKTPTEYTKIINLYSELKNSRYDIPKDKIEMLIQLYEELLSFDDKKIKKLGKMEINQFLLIQHYVNKEGMKLATNALISDDLGQLTMLKPFLNGINPRLLPSKLITDQYKIIAFLIQNTNHVIHDIQIKVYKTVGSEKISVVYNSPIEYYFDNLKSGKKLENRLECLNTLILSNRLSLFYPVGEHRLPFAYAVLSAGPHHPYYQILQMNADVTFENRIIPEGHQ